MKLQELIDVLLVNQMFQVNIETEPSCFHDFERGYGIRCVLWNAYLTSPAAIEYYDYDVKYIDAHKNTILLKKK